MSTQPSLLKTEDRNYAHLNCYHNNSFHSMVRANHFLKFIYLARQQDSVTPPIKSLVRNVLREFENYYDNIFGSYKNASLVEFMKEPTTKKIIEDTKNDKRFL